MKTSPWRHDIDMKNMKKTNYGFTLIETLIVMAMLGLLGGVLVTLVSSGGAQYQHMQEIYQAENEARIALSYITVKIRKNDIVDSKTNVRLVSLNNSNNELTIVDKARGNGAKWIISWNALNKELIEKNYNSELDLSPTSITIAKGKDNGMGITSFSMDYTSEPAMFIFDISYQSDISSKSLQQKLYLRSEVK